VAKEHMREASTTLRLPTRAAALLRLAALATFVFISAPGLSLAKDRCADTAGAVQALREDDHYQATTLLFAAAQLGCEAQARALLDRGAAIDAKDREGKTALAKAAEADKLPLVRLLLERGANVNKRAVDGSTPLFYAAEQDRGAVVALLLERGADPNLPGRKGVRPLAAAAFNGSTQSVEQIMKFGADPNALDSDGSGAIVYAAGHGYAPVVALLLQAGVDVNRRYAHGLTALMWVAGYDASTGVDDADATIKALIEHGAALDLKDDRGKTAADIARDLGHARAAKLLE
jgi:ankyrin repeat protein